MEDNTEGPVFRANKRRKVFRKRAGSDTTNEDEPHVATKQVALIDGNASASIGEEDNAPLSDFTRVRKPKKHGIAFSSSDRTSSRPQNEDEETAIAVAEPHSMEQQNGRFTRQTGKAIVADDKHMSAYIDSKLAEMRSATTTPKHGSEKNKSLADLPSQTQADPITTSTGGDSTPLSPPQPSPPTSIAKPTATTTKSNPTRRPPRQRRPPSPSTLARSSLIDQILRESNHIPHYTPPSSDPNNHTTANGATNRDEGLDLEAAAAAAFKADFLAQAEARNLSRRQPAINAGPGAGSAAAGAAAASSGPKLGGSRAARERMRAAEEAKGKK